MRLPDEWQKRLDEEEALRVEYKKRLDAERSAELALGNRRERRKMMAQQRRADRRSQ